MGEFKFTTRDTSQLNLEKTLAKEEKNLPDFNFSGQTNPVSKTTTREKTASTVEKTETTTANPVKVIEKQETPVTTKPDSEIEQIVNAVICAKNSIVEEVSANFEKKLEKLDDTIIELISCKAENERLKAKIDNLTRENYRLKKETRSFRQVMPGFFIKIKTEGFNL